MTTWQCPIVGKVMNTKVMVPLVGDKVACSVYEKREVYLYLMTLTDLDAHLSLHHGDTQIQWGCIKSNRSFTKLHGARCHLPKGLFKCEACPMSFGSQRGLPTHERHAHPAIRNIKRRGTDPPNTRLWKVEEVNFLRELNEIFSGEKSQTYQVVSKKDTWYVRDREIEINNKKIPNIAPEEAFKYLGAKVGPWKGLQCGIIVPEIISTIKRVRKLSLKPGQKMELLEKYIFTRYIFNLLINPSSEGVLKLLDSEIRQEAKAILHLTPSTAVGFFYTPKNNGGLGLPRFEHLVKLGTLKNGIKIKDSLDPAASSLINESMELKLKRIANSLRINWPATSADIE